MIEAVNSVLASAPLIKSAVADSKAQDATGVVEAIKDAPKAPYISPYVSYDVNLNTTVIQTRDSETGDVVDQITSSVGSEAQRRSDVSIESDRVSSAGSLVQAQETLQSEAISATAAREVASNFAITEASATGSEVFSEISVSV